MKFSRFLNKEKINIVTTNDPSIFGSVEDYNNGYLIKINPNGNCEVTQEKTIVHELSHILMYISGFDFYKHNFLFRGAERFITRHHHDMVYNLTYELKIKVVKEQIADLQYELMVLEEMI